MKKNLPLITILILFNSFLQARQPANRNIQYFGDTSFVKEVGKWFAAWELISRDIFGIDSLRAVEFLLFDSTNVFSTSNVSIPRGELVEGPGLLNRSFVWKKDLHHGSITLPDKQVVPVGLMSFASQTGSANAFFVMPLRSFWEKAGVTSKELGLDNLITGVFLHEFSHSQQMQNFGRKITEFEQNNQFGIDFTDDIVQELFKNDSLYNKLYIKELKKFYDAIVSGNAVARTSLVKTGIAFMKNRHSEFFAGKYDPLKQIDEFFLTMEGMGQYTMYAWLTHTKGARLPVKIAITGVRRGGKWWSQDEGLALFLLLSKNSPAKKWAPLMFGQQTVGIIKLLEKAYK